MTLNLFLAPFVWFKREFIPFRILDRYLFFDFLKNFLGTLILLTSMIIIYEFTNNMKYLVSSKVQQSHVYLYILYSVPGMLVQVVSPALMFSVCFVVGQYSVNKELVAIMVAGVSFLRIITPILFFGFCMWLFMTFFQQFVVIPANKQAQIQFSYMAKGANKLIDFVYQFHVKGKNGFYYVYWIDEKENTVKGGFNYIEISEDGLPVFTVSSQKAKFIESPHQWVLYDVEEVKFNKDLEVVSRENIPEKTYPFPEDIKYFSRPTRNPEEMNFFELAEEIESRIGKGIPYRDVIVHRHAAFAMPLMSFIVVALGALAGAITKRSAGVASLGLTIAVVLLYYILYSTMKTLAENGGLPIWFGIWVTPVMFIIFAYVFYKKMNI
ncbi:LptF/LptG family permease [Leptospira ilyithenensis]|uniref:YjgP/YjgQ family permease n=1 Tax=Leptospira ilyithenensis TaxID=2484901 RepID=A0A4R9LLJ7_9LEPT|nr:LptF/LptG family permease [Leptospira ilyithenensis]TGN06848.1 YjgP/YjgQ family permease [Leptospira ilyithenensis]